MNLPNTPKTRSKKENRLFSRIKLCTPANDKVMFILQNDESNKEECSIQWCKSITNSKVGKCSRRSLRIHEILITDDFFRELKEQK